MLWLMPILIAGKAWCFSGDFFILDNPFSINLSASPDYKNASVNARFGPHSLAGGVLLEATPVRSNDFLRLNYSYDWRLANYLNNKSSFGLGLLDSSHYLGSKFFIGEPVIGLLNNLELTIDRDAVIGMTGSAVKEINYPEAKWDSAKIEAYWKTSGKIIQESRLTMRDYNPQRYWFLNSQRSWFSYQLGVPFSFSSWKFCPFAGIGLQSAAEFSAKNNSDENLASYGALISAPFSQTEFLQFKFCQDWEAVYRTKTSLLSVGAEKLFGLDANWEIYGLVRSGADWEKEKNFGFKLTFLWTEHRPQKESGLFFAKDYREPAKKSDFYADSGFRDDAALNFKEQMHRLNTLRLRNEWTSANLGYRNEDNLPDEPYHSPAFTYSHRGGNCYYQSILTAYWDRENGYDSYVLSYYPDTNPIGHQVEIVRDPKTNRWFMDEYGILQEIIVPPNADLATAALESLKQGTDFTAAPIYGSRVYYWSEPAQDIGIRPSGVSNYLTNFHSTAGKRPRLERGLELFTGPDALWK